MLQETHALPVILVVILIEELGVPMPIPGDLMMMLAGIRAADGVYPLWLVLLSQEVVTVVGATGLFWISERCGRPFVLRFGRFIHLTPAALDRAEGFLRRHGSRAVIAGRLMPGMRIFTPIAAGVLGMPYRVYVPSVAVGGFLYILGYTLLGYFVGPKAVALFDRVSIPVNALLSLAALVAFVLVMRRLRRAPRFVAPHPSVAFGAACCAGAVAGVAALLAANAFLGIVSFVRRLFGDAPLVTARDVGSGVRFLTQWPAFLLGAAALGALAYALRLVRLAPPIRMLIAVAVPLALTVLVLDPLLGRNARIPVDRQIVRIVLDVIRCVTLGLVLGALLPLLPRDAGPVGEREELVASEVLSDD